MDKQNKLIDVFQIIGFAAATGWVLMNKERI
jgi:hypothetical protein